MPVVPFSGSGAATVTLAAGVSGMRHRILGFHLSTVLGTDGGTVSLFSGSNRPVVTVAAGGQITIDPNAGWRLTEGQVFAGDTLTVTASGTDTTFGGVLYYVDEPFDAVYATPIGLTLLLTQLAHN